ncbi:multidrug ABC transporter ATP-binding protein [Escherichia coli]|uniref:Multidrug ABC transporter ATP-binding protein n=1 Tax=Escherichia coli TaxID=562 RepID=A0A376YF17_ECOLX|nr:multidrug ABC transporter ATP-binding protein [Escherichia coli]
MLVETPQILILDEATASIDSGTEQAIQHALAAVREHTTLVVIAHRLSTIVDADTILVLHRGQPWTGHSPATAGGPGTLLADVSTATCGRRAGSQRA